MQPENLARVEDIRLEDCEGNDFGQIQTTTVIPKTPVAHTVLHPLGLVQGTILSVK